MLVVGSTGYIGKSVVRELVRRGFNVVAVARERSAIKGTNSKEKLGYGIDVVVSCLASRTGGVRDSWRVDYEATRNNLLVGRKFGASHFMLLSAICVQRSSGISAYEAQVRGRIGGGGREGSWVYIQHS